LEKTFSCLNAVLLRPGVADGRPRQTSARTASAQAGIPTGHFPDINISLEPVLSGCCKCYSPEDHSPSLSRNESNFNQLDHNTFRKQLQNILKLNQVSTGNTEMGV